LYILIFFLAIPKQKFLIAKVWLIEELFYYNYPFYLPNFFQQKLTKHELEVRFKLFQVFTSGSIEKEIFVQEFFKSYPSVLNNQQKTKIKNHFIELVKVLEECDLIKSKLRLFLDHPLVKVLHSREIVFDKFLFITDVNPHISERLQYQDPYLIY
jgi:hypothetical protein